MERRPTEATLSEWNNILELMVKDENFQTLIQGNDFSVEQGIFDQDGTFTTYVYTPDDHKQIGYTEVNLDTKIAAVFKLDNSE